MPMKKRILPTLTAFLGGLPLVVATLAPATTFADSSNINFENPPYSIGNINGQDGWSKTGPYDVAVVDNTYNIPSFGGQSLRISNAESSGSFGDQTFSKSLVNEAGETTAQSSTYSGGVRQKQFEAKFDIASTKQTQQEGLFVSVSPDRGDGARMGYVGFDDQADGVHVIFYDYQDKTPFGSLASPANGCGDEDDFIMTDVATIDRGAHSIKLTMNFVDGPKNDVVKLYVDGNMVHHGTSWEDYYRWCTESGGGLVNNASADVSRTVDSLIFMARNGSAPDTLGSGYLVDNLKLSSGVKTPENKDECKKDGWRNFSDPEFKNQGLCIKHVEEQEHHKMHNASQKANEHSNLLNRISSFWRN